MGLGVTDEQRLENYRIRFELSHARVKELASYIRITDAAIWGFLAFAFIELFKDLGLLCWKIPLFCVLVIISMILWRYTVGKYQNDIIIEYQAIKSFETALQIFDKYSMTGRQKDKMSDNRYVDSEHLKFDKIANAIMWVAIIILLAWIIAYSQIFIHLNC